jgi:hypothetical protein
VIRVTLLLIGLTYAVPATACHRFARWYYPTPQRCSVAYARLPRAAVVHSVLRLPDPPPTRGLDIPLPDMSAQWGGVMDTELELSMQRQRAIKLLTQSDK